MLEVRGLNAWYGSSHVLQSIDMTVEKGEIVCIIGRNGAGKTTTLKSIMGLIAKRSGSVKFDGGRNSRTTAAYAFWTRPGLRPGGTPHRGGSQCQGESASGIGRDPRRAPRSRTHCAHDRYLSAPRRTS